MLSPVPMQRGFSLIELAIGLLLISIVTVLAAPAFNVWIQNARIRNAAEGILNGLQLARAEAVRRNASVQLIFDTGAAWSVSTVATGTEIQKRVTTADSSTAFVAITPNGADRVTFNGMGWLAANDDGSPVITQVDVTSALLSGDEIRPLRVTVGAGGIMKMCDPALAAGDPRACS